MWSKKVAIGIFWSEFLGLTGLIPPLLLLGFVLLFIYLFVNVGVLKITKKVSSDSGLRGWVPVCRELSFLALLSAPTSEGSVSGLGLTVGEVDFLACWGGLLPRIGDEVQGTARL